MAKVLKVKEAPMECPFCGNAVAVLSSPEGYCRFECCVCGAGVTFNPPHGKEENLDVEKSIEAWNKRSESSELGCCPFCGERVVFITFPGIGNMFGCYYGCGASVIFRGAERNREKSVEAWNRRVE